MTTLQARAKRTTEKQAALSAERARSLLDYDPATDLIRWKARQGSVVAGTVAGNVGKDGYTRVRVGGRDYLAHRLEQRTLNRPHTRRP